MTTLALTPLMRKAAHAALALTAVAVVITACGPQPQLTAQPTPAPVPPNLVAAADWLLARQTGAGAITEQDDTASPGQTALAALALTLAGREITGSVLANLEALSSDPAATPSDLARLVVFLQTTGYDPYAFGPKGLNLIARLADACQPESCGRNQAERAQILLALGYAGEDIPSLIINGVARSQFSSGGWPYAFDGEAESVRTTAWLVIALTKHNLLPEHQQHAIDFLIARQHPDGSWSNASIGQPSAGDAGTTALALMALQARQAPIPSSVLVNAKMALWRFQQATGGGFNYYAIRPGASVEATTLAIIALMGWPDHPSHLTSVSEDAPPAGLTWLGWVGFSLPLWLWLGYVLFRPKIRSTTAWGKAH